MKSIALASFVFIGLIQIAVSFTTHHTIKLHLKPLAHLIRQSNHDSLQLRRRVTLLTTKETSDDEMDGGKAGSKAKPLSRDEGDRAGNRD